MGLRAEGDLLASKYRIDSLLGSGGMGDVYRATNVLIDRAVAVKLLHPKHTLDAELVERFVREARVANIVRHPNVVDVLDIDKDVDGSPFIVQELLHGEDLASYVRARGRLTLQEIADLVVPIVDAVAAAHTHGVIHRDIKPANIFLARQHHEAPPSSHSRRAVRSLKHQDDEQPQQQQRSGMYRRTVVTPNGNGNRTGHTHTNQNHVVPKLLDFGISKLRGADIRATAVGVVFGTPAYLAPELLSGVCDADARSDVWSLGVMLFELLTGRKPFLQAGASIYITIATTDAPRVVDVAPEIDANVGRVVDRCLLRSVDARYGSASELAVDLVQALDAALQALQHESPAAAPLECPEPVVPDLALPPAAAQPMTTDAAVTLHSAVDDNDMYRSSELHFDFELERSLRPMHPTTSSLPPQRFRPGMSSHPPPSSSLRMEVAKPRDEVAWLAGILVLGITALTVAGVVLAFGDRSSGWTLARSLLTEPSAEVSTLVQAASASVAAMLGAFAFYVGLKRWMDGSRGLAVAIAVVCGAFLVTMLELARAAW